MQNKTLAETNKKMKERVPDGIFDLCDEFPVNDKEVSFEEYFWIENYLISPNLKYIAIFVRRNEQRIGSYSHEEYIIFVHSLIDNKIIYYGEYIESKLKINNYFFSHDSQYLIHRKTKKLLYIKLFGNQIIKKRKIESKRLFSCDSDGNITLLKNNSIVQIIQLQSDKIQTVQLKCEISFFQILFTKYAYVESNNKIFIINIDTQKILISWTNNKLTKKPKRIFWSKLILQGKSFSSTLRNLQTGKIIRSIKPKFGFRSISYDQSSIYLFQIVKRKQKKNSFSRFDILKGVYRQLNINITPIKYLQTLNNDYYIDVEDVEEVDDDEDKIKRLRYFNISELTK
ncbi:unnamed protein product [Paramecium sonneborni]|uniref:Uncharacterized protein n=1 Tax=Paramecium sonneborni TaxID=65129 RepID=A0A8S1MAV7_9CILI|nr:unnamed protein product [Paramecium sonneborni]